MLMRYLRRRDIQILIALVVVSTTWYGYAQYRIDRHRQSLEELANEERTAFFADVIEDSPAEGTEVALHLYTEEEIESKSKNSPFIGMEMRGWPVGTIVSGKVVMRDRSIVA